MSGIGSYLRQTRESMGYSLDQVQQSTKIHIEYLRALENDQFESLPSPFYVRAFLRTYAHSLGLDAQPLLDRYERIAIAGNPAGRRATPSRGTGRHTMQPPSRNRMSGGQPRIGRTYSPQSQRMAPPSRPPQQPSEQQPFVNRQTQPFQRPKPPVQGTGPNRPAGDPMSASIPPGQATQRFSVPPTAQQDQSTGPNTLLPRRVSQEVSKGVEQGDGKPKKKPNWLIRVAAVGALILIPVGVFATNLWPGADSAAEQGQQEATQENTGSTPTVDAQTPEEVTLQLAETGSDVEGDLFTLSGVDKIEIQIKANKGESQLRYGNKVNDPEGETFELKVGDQQKIEGEETVWFRLGTPSNTEIKVNGEEIDTTAQDVPKSYRIQLEK
jgi:cytoskeleton protein RodZ